MIIVVRKSAIFSGKKTLPTLLLRSVDIRRERLLTVGRQTRSELIVSVAIVRAHSHVRYQM